MGSLDQASLVALPDVIRNGTVQRREAAGRPSKPNRPREGDIVAHDPDGVGIFRYDDIDVVPGLSGAIDALPLYGGRALD